MSGRLDVVAQARLWLGTPYVHQASRLGAGTDCLGLLRGVWRALLGPEPEGVPAYTMDWSEAEGCEEMLAAARRWLVPLPVGALAAGDVVVFRMRAGMVAKHLGIVSEAGPAARFIHAYTGHGVVENALTEPWARRIVGRFEFPKGA
jgi:NlpC/P60 family putative phage cell wall peptidase